MAEAYGKRMRHQRHNAENLSNKFVFTYEEFISKTSDVLERMGQFLPELSDIDINKLRLMIMEYPDKFKYKTIANFNGRYFRKITQERSDKLNKIFAPYESDINFFGHSLVHNISEFREEIEKFEEFERKQKSKKIN